ncbi:e1-E2 ATPase [Actinomyces graevenitzii F0530]|uniref:E1-E2 ATPase n=1 Tax=Actinomyces graevenitzii F0530 TaxID=1321817 RepID=U1QE17_9ACTO|nr:cation-translocating P-type ATPase [Actinomyces graevenitzii]ERH20566.1 e1-E2 ATPase [Actinomyces graevenitzii F0530]
MSARVGHASYTPPAVDELYLAQGLSFKQVAHARAADETNEFDNSSSRSIVAILRANVFTIFNAILASAVVVVLAVGSWQDAVFGFVLLLNTLTGTIAELRAKRALDNLAVLAAPTAHVIRDGEAKDIEVSQVVLGELLELRSGDQVPADGQVLSSNGCEIDESILTGESVSVRKHENDQVLSGTTVIGGSARIRVTAVGEHSYANRLAMEARKYSVVTSELQEGTNRVLTWISWVIVPMTLLLLWSQLRVAGGISGSLNSGQWKAAVVLAVAGVVGMVPQGLVLLTSVNFAAAAMTLARRKVLVQELPAVEVLARVDMLCLDKTGTLTSGAVELDHIESCLGSACADGDGGSPAAGKVSADAAAGGSAGTGSGAVVPASADDAARAALAYLVGGSEANATGSAIAAGLTGLEPAQARYAIAFNSARKWSAVQTQAGAYVLGAPEIVLAGSTGSGSTEADNADSDGTGLGSTDNAALERVKALAGTGKRVLVLAHSNQALDQSENPTLPKDLTAALLVVLAEQVRPDAAQTLDYFKRQGVAVRVISGDNPVTVAAIAAHLGLRNPDGGEPVGVDARTLPAIEETQALADVLEKHTVFGRVTPEQKRAFVNALKSRGHTVAMTGDGVNDALALKDADLGIAMGNAAPATKAVSRLVLLNSQFDALPSVVAEGRRVIANMERVASLFLTKTTWAALLAAVVAITGFVYPFLPRQLTIVSSLTIGIPAFVLALAPTNQRYRAGFLARVLRLSVPAGVIVVVGVLCARLTLILMGSNRNQISSVCTLVLVAGGLWLLSLTARPWVCWRALLVVIMSTAALAVVLLAPLRGFFDLAALTANSWLVLACAAGIVCAALEALGRYNAARAQDRQAHGA